MRRVHLVKGVLGLQGLLPRSSSAALRLPRFRRRGRNLQSASAIAPRPGLCHHVQNGASNFTLFLSAMQSQRGFGTSPSQVALLCGSRTSTKLHPHMPTNKTNKHKTKQCKTKQNSTIQNKTEQTNPINKRPTASLSIHSPQSHYHPQADRIGIPLRGSIVLQM